MDGLQLLVSKLHNFQQHSDAKFSEFEEILATGTDQDRDKDLYGEVIALETKIESQLKVHKKVDTDNKLQLKELQKEVEHKKAKVRAKKKLMSTLEEELQHLSIEQHSLTEGTKEETTARQLEEEEAKSAQQLGLEINKVKGGWLQFVFTQINSQKPSSCCFFTLKLDENRKYIVGDCQPEISDLNGLVSKLNLTNNLSTFVHSVRKRFTALVNK